jgi:fructose/tagatose bisphosphate aldolase
MSKHGTNKDKEKNLQALGLIRRGLMKEAALVLKGTSNANQSKIKNRITRGQSHG